MTCPESAPEYRTNPDGQPRRRKADPLDLALVCLFLALLHGDDLWKRLMLQILPEPDPDSKYEAMVDQLLDDLANQSNPDPR